jgi:RNA polymerase sigma-70 factor (ECF subfamily)
VSRFTDIAPDHELLLRARNGDEAAWQSLYQIYAGSIYTLVRRMVALPAVAEDLTQDTFVELMRHLPQYAGSGSFAGWVRSIAVNQALMYIRSPWSRWSRLTDRWQLDGEVAGGASVLGADETLAATQWQDSELAAALNELAPVARSVVWLHDVEGYRHDEIAKLFDRSLSFSKSQLARAHAGLRKRLQPGGDLYSCSTTTTP